MSDLSHTLRVAYVLVLVVLVALSFGFIVALVVGNWSYGEMSFNAVAICSLCSAAIVHAFREVIAMLNS